MRNPNGFGTVIKLSGTRRNPYMAKKTVGYNEKGHPIIKIVGYFPTKVAAIKALSDDYGYNDITNDKITLAKMYEIFLENTTLAKGSLVNMKTAFKLVERYHKTPYKQIRAFDIQQIIKEHKGTYSRVRDIKLLFYNLDKLAISMDLNVKGIAQALEIGERPAQKSYRDSYTKEEINSLWKAYYNEVEYADIVLIYLYTGFRARELLKLDVEKIDLVNDTITSGSKTKAGKNRIVPIHNRIKPLIVERLKKEEVLFDFSYSFLNVKTRGVLDALGIKKTLHECRHTFETELDNQQANKKCIDLLMGHTSKDIGNRVYNHKTVQQLRDTIDLIRY